MSFKARILLALTVAGLLPIVLLGWLSYRANRAELLDSVNRSQAQAAEQGARYTEKTLLQLVDTLRVLVASIPFETLSPDEVGTVLQLPYRQLPQLNALVLLDQASDAVAQPVYAAVDDPDAGARTRMSAEELDVFASKIPLQLALASGIALGPPYQSGTPASPRVAVAIRVSQDPPRAVAAELSLSELATLISELERTHSLAALVDGTGARVTGSALQFPELQKFGADALAGGKPALRTLNDEAGETYLAAFAPMGGLGWGVLLAQRGDVAFRAAERVRDYSIFWALVALVLASVVGLTLARGLTRPITELSEAARSLTTGDYDRQVRVTSGDELGQFAQAFNHMALEVKRRNVEIRRWNEELQERVNQRTAELKDAQAQIERTRRLAALASMGAGVAHEVNNPMTALIGMVSLVREDLGGQSANGELLGVALQEADRITRIVDSLRRISERERNPVGKRFSLTVPLQAVLAQQRAELERRRITVQLVAAPDLPEMEGDPRQIEQVVQTLVKNAIEAMPEGGSLELTLANVEGAVRLVVRDTGAGIPAAIQERIFDPFFTTKQARGQLGLGLSTAHNIVELHHGQMRVESSEGAGAAFSVVFPAAAAGAHMM